MHELFEALNENIKKHDEIIIMTHARPDLDGMGSALALFKIVKSMGKKCYIVSPLKKLYRSLDKAMKLLSQNNITIEFKGEEETRSRRFRRRGAPASSRKKSPARTSRTSTPSAPRSWCR